MNDEQYDVMVIGGGGAGMAAALTAADLGARVCLLEASAKTGGSTALSGGVFYAAGTRQQNERGISDSAEAMYGEIVSRHGDNAVKPVVRRLCAEATSALEWLEGLGVEFPAALLQSPSGRTIPRSHLAIGQGAAIARALDTAVSQQPIDVALKSRVQTLLTDAHGRVCGARVGDSEIHAGAVILSTGSYGADMDLVRRFLPKTKPVSGIVWYTGHQDNRGDGIRMGESVGAATRGTNSALVLASPQFTKAFEVFIAYWAITVNKAGRRFVREDAAYWEIAEAFEAQPDSRGFAIFDDRLLEEEAKPFPMVRDMVARGEVPCSWMTKPLKEQIEAGKVISAATLAELAAKIGIDPKALAETVSHYNGFCRAGKDRDFDKDPENMHEIAVAPFYAVETTPSVLVVSGSGLAIDEKARVLDRAGRPIPGLYAAGETQGSTYGPGYVASGYAVGSAITYGRIAGAEAARFAGDGAPG